MTEPPFSAPHPAAAPLAPLDQRDRATHTTALRQGLERLAAGGLQISHTAGDALLMSGSVASFMLDGQSSVLDDTVKRHSTRGRARGSGYRFGRLDRFCFEGGAAGAPPAGADLG